MQLKTKRLVLKPLGGADAEDMISLLTNEAVGRTFMVPEIRSKEDEEKTFSALLGLSHTEGRYLLGIYLGGKLIGIINDVEISGKSMELGWAIHPDYHGKGYAAEAAEALINELFALGFEEIRAGAFEGNASSFRVMEKLGMKRTDFEETIEYRGEKHRCSYYAIKK